MMTNSEKSKLLHYQSHILFHEKL